MLRCQINLEVTRRQYNDTEKARMYDLFGEPERWGQTLKTMLWTHASVVVQPFEEMTTVDLPVPCTFDFNVAATKFFGGLERGEVPLLLLFSGTMFYRDEFGDLQVGQILGQGSEFPSARQSLAGNDGALLSEQRVAQFAS